MSSESARISVALVTRDRPESLARCLTSWRAQVSAPFEIVVSDDSNAHQAARVRQLAADHNCHYVSGPQRGLYANRNQASLACRGTHILSADDDHTHPPDYLSQIQQLVATDSNRIWIFGERHPDRPDSPLECPPELHRSGAGQTPADPRHCAAIADGASIFPRRVFDSGLRYDESYPFGPLWYLWGRQLARRGWRMSFSDATFVWHHVESTGPLMEWNDFNLRLEATTYVAWNHALWLNRTLGQLCYVAMVTARRVLWPTPISETTVRCRLSVSAAARAWRRACAARPIYA